MLIEVIVTADFEAMSAAAADWTVARIRKLEDEEGKPVLGLATGNSPTGLYRHLAAAANRGEVDSSLWTTFNLDEYVGLEGADPDARARHPESYHSFMSSKLFSLLDRKPNRTSLPPGQLIDRAVLERELDNHPEDWELKGASNGSAVRIRKPSRSPYLAWIRDEVLAPYSKAIADAGGIDLQILGIGGHGHVAFHESGIPFDLEGLLLVQLDDLTRRHAVEDGAFPDLALCPQHALTMSIDLVFKARSVVVLANGPRKTSVIAKSLLGEVTPEIPMSYLQIYARRGGDAVVVLDQAAAAELTANRASLRERGISLIVEGE